MAKTLCRRNSSSSGKEVEGVMMVYGCDDVRLNLLMCWITRSSCSSHQSKPVSQPNKQTGGVGSRTHGRSLPSFPLPLQRGDVQVPQRFPMPVQDPERKQSSAFLGLGWAEEWTYGM